MFQLLRQQLSNHPVIFNFLKKHFNEKVLSSRIDGLVTRPAQESLIVTHLTWSSDSFKISIKFKSIHLIKGEQSMQVINAPAEGKSHSNQNVWASRCLPSHSSRSADDRWLFSRRFFCFNRNSFWLQRLGANHLPEGDGTNCTLYVNDGWLLTDLKICIN